MAEKAPGAWLINFTNPAGMVTEAAQRVLGDRVVGICDSPAGLCRRVAKALGEDPSRMWFDYFGLNHLGWLQAARDGRRDRLPELLADEEKLATFEEGRLFGADWLRESGGAQWMSGTLGINTGKGDIWRLQVQAARGLLEIGQPVQTRFTAQLGARF